MLEFHLWLKIIFYVLPKLKDILFLQYCSAQTKYYGDNYVK